MSTRNQTNRRGMGAREPIAPVRPTDVSTDSESAVPPNPDRFPIVGIGASAGGLSAFEAFFSAIPADAEPSMAYVLVQHLSPDHRSILAELIARQTSMPVCEASDGLEVRPGCIYVIPPNSNLTLLAGRLRVTEASDEQRPRLPIDHFFRSLAEERREAAIGIILSGSGSDGTLGIRAIKAEGGFVLVQDPETTEHAGMPRSAILTGLVDLVLRPSEMPKLLSAIGIRVAASAFDSDGVQTPNVREELSHICNLIRTRTGHDFSPYKESTIIRRIERRMALHQIDSLEEYRHNLQTNADESDLLFRDLLIGVTSFFRDLDAFESLRQQALPRLFKDKLGGGCVRVWVCGCSTGEEAYSIAMLLQEQMQALPDAFKVQIFATDIDTRAIECARAGRYPASIGAQVSSERLARHFIHDTETGEYVVCRNLRDMVLFSEQDVTRDPPFSRLDLITCRNLLIYINGELQKRLIPLFHYALVPGGVLFLGPSETAGESSTLFAPMDRKWKLYARKSVGVTPSPFVFGDLLAPLSTYRGHHRRAETRSQVESASSLRSITEHALLEYFAESAVLVNVHGQILYIHGRTGRFLEPAPGDATMSIVDMAREGLKRELVTCLHHAVTTATTVSRGGLRIQSDGAATTTNVTVRPVSPLPLGAALPEPLFLVIFSVVADDTVSPSMDSAAAASGTAFLTDSTGRVTELESELLAKEEYLQTTIEELETSNEELRSVNEELQSVNEELQSTNEELETSKEELQSVNEELATVNAELQNKVAELSHANNDMNNLLASTGVGTLFVDRQLRIARFTPAVTELINLIPTDVGRPLGHIVSNLRDYDQLTEDAQSVLETLGAKQATVQTRIGVWFLMHMRPYRTVENVVDGVVITFVDISAAKHAEASLRRSAQFPDADPSPVLRATREGTLRYANAAARDWLKSCADGSAEVLSSDLRRLVQGAFEQNRAVLAEFSDVAGRRFEFTALRLPEEDYAHLYGVEVTERLRLDTAHGVAVAIAEGIAASVQDPLLVLDGSLRVLLANQAFCSGYSLPLERVEGQLLFELAQGAWDRPELRELLDRVRQMDSPSSANVSARASIRWGEQLLVVQARRSSQLGQQDEIIVLSIEHPGAREPD